MTESEHVEIDEIIPPGELPAGDDEPDDDVPSTWWVGALYAVEIAIVGSVVMVVAALVIGGIVAIAVTDAPLWVAGPPLAFVYGAGRRCALHRDGAVAWVRQQHADWRHRAEDAAGDAVWTVTRRAVANAWRRRRALGEAEAAEA